jgi:hypothetical protein
MPLHPAESAMMAKTLTYIMEDGLDTEPGFSLKDSRWFQQLVGLIPNQSLMNDLDRLLTGLFPALLYDSVLVGLNMVQTVSGDNLGSPEEQINYATEVVTAVEGSTPVDLGHVYLPLVLAGMLLNYRIRELHENPWNTLSDIQQAWQGRLRLADTSFEWISKVLADYVRRGEHALEESGIARPKPSSTDRLNKRPGGR